MAETEAPVVEAETPTLTEAAGEPKAAAAPSEETLQQLFGDEPKDDPVEPEEENPPQVEKPRAKDKEQPKAKGAPQDPEEDEEFSAAFQALLTSGVPASVLKNASKTDLLKWSQKQAKREADIQRAFQERADLQKKIDEKAKETTAHASEPSSGMPTDDADLKAVIAPIVEVFGPEMEKSLSGFGSKLIEKALAAVEAKYAEKMGGLDVRARLSEELLLDHTRARLAERFPKLSDDAEFEKVIEKTRALAATGAYNDTPTIRGQAFSAMSDACGLLFGTPASADAETEKKSVNRSRDAGQPRSKTSTRVPGMPRGVEERAWRAFNLAEDGQEEAARRTMLAGG